MRKLEEKGTMVRNMKKGLMKPVFFMALLMATLFLTGCIDGEIFEAPRDFENLNMTLSFNNNRLYSGYLLETTVTDGDTEVAKITKSLSFNQEVYELSHIIKRLNDLSSDNKFVTEERVEYYTLTEHYYQEDGLWVKETGNFKQNKDFQLLVDRDMFEEGYVFKQDGNLVVFTGNLKDDKVQNFIPGFELNDATNATVWITYNNNARQLHLFSLSYVNHTNKTVNVNLKISYNLNQIIIPFE